MVMVVIMKKENKNLIIGIIIGAVVIVMIFFGLFEFNSGYSSNPSNNKNTYQSDIKEVLGLNDIVKVGNLSFKLDGVYLQWSPGIYAEYYNMFWSFVVTNDGDTIENVSDCGILLFEDGSQYNFDVSQGDLDISGKCIYYGMVPGARTTIYSTFYFSNSSYHPQSWLGYPKSWEEVPGSKITYFSQQNKGLVKYSIDKGEIVNINKSVN